jgi:hypothetical protein
LNSLWAHDHSYYYFLIQWLTFLLLCYCVSTWCSSWLPVHLLFIAVLVRGYTVAFTKVFTMCQIYLTWIHHFHAVGFWRTAVALFLHCSTLRFTHMRSYLIGGLYPLCPFIWGFLKAYLVLASRWVLVCFLISRWGVWLNTQSFSFLFQYAECHPYLNRERKLDC